MEPEIIHKSSALDLPECWDSAVEDYFQTREFLYHTEKYNPCKQRYYLLYLDGIFETAAIVYSLRLDLLTYLRIPSPLTMNITGVPCSVSAGGIIGNPDYLPELISSLKTRETGLLLFLNLSSEIAEKEIIPAKTLPTIHFVNRFRSWEHYLCTMKSGYRRRFRLLTSPFSFIQKEQTACSSFNEQMYKQYLAVLKRSKGKLETLSPEFFRELPSCFKLSTFYRAEKLLGWYISTSYHEKFYFFLGGVDYKLNRTFNTYFNILLNVLRDGIEAGATLVDLGQTAEIPKLRLGGKLVPKYMGGYHSNRVMQALLRAGKSLLEYSGDFRETHVFKGEIV